MKNNRSGKLWVNTGKYLLWKTKIIATFNGTHIYTELNAITWKKEMVSIVKMLSVLSLSYTGVKVLLYAGST